MKEGLPWFVNLLIPGMFQWTVFGIDSFLKWFIAFVFTCWIPVIGLIVYFICLRHAYQNRHLRGWRCCH